MLRSQSGVYQQTVSNGLINGTAIAMFSLDIFCKLTHFATCACNFIDFPLDFPEGQPGQSLVYARPGETVTLAAFTNISANPQIEFYLWTKPPIEMLNLTDGGRYSAPSLGQLRITNIILDDDGDYEFYMTNGVGRNGTLANVTELLMSMQNESIIYFNSLVQLKIVG